MTSISGDYYVMEADSRLLAFRCLDCFSHGCRAAGSALHDSKVVEELSPKLCSSG